MLHRHRHVLLLAQGNPTGVLILAGAAAAPFGSIRELFDSVTPELGARANAAYNGGGTRLVYKNAHGEGRCVSSQPSH